DIGVEARRPLLGSSRTPQDSDEERQPEVRTCRPLPPDLIHHVPNWVLTVPCHVRRLPGRRRRRCWPVRPGFCHPAGRGGLSTAKRSRIVQPAPKVFLQKYRSRRGGCHPVDWIWLNSYTALAAPAPGFSVGGALRGQCSPGRSCVGSATILVAKGVGALRPVANAKLFWC